jgi:galactokinase/galacturonokinase
LTKNFPKPLLKIGNNTILGRMLDDIDQINDITEHIIVTNHKFAPIFEEWVKEQGQRESVKGKEALDLGPQTLDNRSSDLPFEIGIFFSGLTRSLVNSDYNLRVYECKTAAWNMLAYTDQPLKTFDKTFLRDIPKATFDKTRIAMPARFARRAEHFYSEYRRVRQGVTAWETGNMKLFGKLSFDSCESSIHNYECGSPELIAIYEIMRDLPGVYGGRFSGAGFKGACIALVDPAYKADIEKVLTEKYLEQFPEYEKTFQVFWVRPDDGARFV